MKKYKLDSQRLALSELKEINYHYHAAVGFLSNWEFVDKEGRCLDVDGKAIGMSKVLSILDSSLSGFSLSDFKKQFEDGDIEDVLNVWRVDCEKSL